MTDWPSSRRGNNSGGPITIIIIIIISLACSTPSLCFALDLMRKPAKMMSLMMMPGEKRTTEDDGHRSKEGRDTIRISLLVEGNARTNCRGGRVVHPKDEIGEWGHHKCASFSGGPSVVAWHHRLIFSSPLPGFPFLLHGSNCFRHAESALGTDNFVRSQLIDSSLQ